MTDPDAKCPACKGSGEKRLEGTKWLCFTCGGTGKVIPVEPLDAAALIQRAEEYLAAMDMLSAADDYEISLVRDLLALLTARQGALPPLRDLNRPSLWQAYQQAEAKVTALEAALQKWREWAQFVYLGGGPLSLPDDEALRTAVCAVQDAREAAKVTALETALATATKERDAESENADAWHRQFQACKVERDALRDQVTTEQRAKDGLRALCDSLVDDKATLHKEIVALRDQVAQLQQERDKAEIEAANLRVSESLVLQHVRVMGDGPVSNTPSTSKDRIGVDAARGADPDPSPDQPETPR